MADEIPTITEDEYAELAAAEEVEMQAYIQQQVSQPAAHVMSLFAETEAIETLEDAAKIAFWRSKLCTDEGGENV
jgi:hypothetical protein